MTGGCFMNAVRWLIEVLDSKKLINIIVVFFSVTVLVILFNIRSQLANVDSNLEDVENSTRETMSLLNDIKDEIVVVDFEQNFVHKIEAAGLAARSAKEAIATMNQILDNGRLGVFSKYSPFEKTQTDVVDFNFQALKIFRFWRDVICHRPVFKSQIIEFIEKHMPDASRDDATNRGILKGFEYTVDLALYDYDVLLSLQREDGSYPKNVIGKFDKIKSSGKDLKDQPDRKASRYRITGP
jgi:hypothetical protein